MVRQKVKPFSRRAFIGSAAAGMMSLSAFLNCGSDRRERIPDDTGSVYPLDRVGRSGIKITGIQVTPLSYVPPDGRFLWKVADYAVWKTDSALCRVYTDQGIIGIGEGSPYSNPDKIRRYTDDYITPVMTGENPFDVDFLTCGGPHTGYLARAAWAGVNNACWDIIGKALNRPVYSLLAAGGAEPRLRLYASGGVEHAWYEKGTEQLIEEALRYKAEGYDAFKFRNGTNWKYSGMTLKKYIPILRKLREAVGPDFRLMIEKHPWTFKEIVNELCPHLRNWDSTGTRSR